MAFAHLRVVHDGHHSFEPPVRDVEDAPHVILHIVARNFVRRQGRGRRDNGAMRRGGAGGFSTGHEGSPVLSVRIPESIENGRASPFFWARYILEHCIPRLGCKLHEAPRFSLAAPLTLGWREFPASAAAGDLPAKLSCANGWIWG